jgi:hypothetical protein
VSRPPEQTRARPRLLQQLGLASVSLIVSLAIAELAVRVLGLTDPAFREPDEVLGWRPVPGAHGRWRREGDAEVRITEHGFRGVAIGPGEPAAGTLRVALVGDSFIEARQVALEASVGARLGGDLEACAGPVEVLAFGVSGYGTAQEYLLYRERIAPYHPDLVVLAFLSGNDVSDNHPALQGGASGRPFFSVGPNDTLLLDASFRDSEAFRARAEEGALSAILRSSQLVRALDGLGGHGNGAVRGEVGLSDEVFAPPATDAWRDAWDRTEALLRHYARDVRADGARFAVVTLSSASQVDPDPNVRERFRRDVHAESLDYPDARVAAAGTRDGYRVLALAPALRAYAEAHGAPLHGFPNTAMGTGHWNETGHARASSELARWLCAEGLAAPPDRPRSTP